jgi:hypothetical protein
MPVMTTNGLLAPTASSKPNAPPATQRNVIATKPVKVTARWGRSEGGAEWEELKSLPRNQAEAELINCGPDFQIRHMKGSDSVTKVFFGNHSS